MAVSLLRKHQIFMLALAKLRCVKSGGLARIFHELLSRDHETGNPLAGLSGAQRARRGWACHLATAGCLFRGVLERYVAGADTRGRQEGLPDPRSQQVIHEIAGLDARCFAASPLGLPGVSSSDLRKACATSGLGKNGESC
jgi:hypothetical protein